MIIPPCAFSQSCFQERYGTCSDSAPQLSSTCGGPPFILTHPRHADDSVSRVNASGNIPGGRIETSIIRAPESTACVLQLATYPARLDV